MISQEHRLELLALAKSLEDQAKRIRIIAEGEDIIPRPEDCYNCEYYNHGNGDCHKWGMTTPLASREFGCDEFVSLLPF